MFVDWAQEQKLIIANTVFKKRWGLRWTHCQQGRKRQIDYFCLDTCRRQTLLDSGVFRVLNMNSDHRAVYVKLRLENKVIQRWRRKAFKKIISSVGWQPGDDEHYKQMLDKKVMDINVSRFLDERSRDLDNALKILEETVVESARECRHLVERAETCLEEDTLSKDIKNLIASRRLAGHQGSERAEISKAISKKTRKLLRFKQDCKVRGHLEDLRGLKSIANVRNNGKKPLLKSMMTRAGRVLRADRR